MNNRKDEIFRDFCVLKEKYEEIFKHDGIDIETFGYFMMLYSLDLIHAQSTDENSTIELVESALNEIREKYYKGDD